jgi:hypothetical protein
MTKLLNPNETPFEQDFEDYSMPDNLNEITRILIQAFLG